MPKLSSVLLVDDDSTNNFLNALLLKRLQVTDHLLVAENGAEALALLAAPGAASPSLILLDVNRPVLNGIEFLEAYQQLPLAQQQASRIVMLTTSMAGRDLAHIQDLPVAGLISKPLTESKIRDMLQQHFQ